MRLLSLFLVTTISLNIGFKPSVQADQTDAPSAAQIATLQKAGAK